MSNLPPPLSGKLCPEKYPFIRETLTVRLPQILTKTVDRLCRLPRDNNSTLDTQIKQAIHELQGLRHGLHRNYSFGKNPDGSDKLWFEANWLELECYLYQEIHKIITGFSELSDFDYFLESKLLAEGVILPKIDETCLKELLHMSLWANRKDLSLSSGEVDKNTSSEVDLSDLSNNLLVDKTEEILKILKKSKSVAFVLDNCGWEFFSDLKLAKHLQKAYGAKICFYPKQIPWFISDVTDSDVARLKKSAPKITDFDFECRSDSFWTTDKSYFEMSGELKNEFAGFDAVIFKGDLNYRKLVGDLAWNLESENMGSEQMGSVFKKLNFELDTNIIVLRTLKSEVCVGLEKVDLSKLDSDWLVTGKYGVIDLVQSKNKC